MKKVLIVLLTIIFMLTSAAAFAKEKPEPEEIIGDLVFLRPLGFVSLVVGTAVFVVALPVAALSKSTKQTADVLLKKPFDYTFTRPLGELESGL